MNFISNIFSFVKHGFLNKTWVQIEIYKTFTSNTWIFNCIEIKVIFRSIQYAVCRMIISPVIACAVY
jgi:hypothetical protein